VSGPDTLAKVMKGGNPMAVVAAVRQVEIARQAAVEETGGGAVRQTPGLVVIVEVAGRRDQIVAPPMPAPMIDVTSIESAVD
jgi:hypothetical protein